jgi:voltage-gated potassium channel
LSTRNKLYEIVFGTETPAGKRFDVILLWVIIVSVLVVMIESVNSIEAQYGSLFRIVEWVFTIVFSIEYLMRIYVHPRPLRYIFSFWGLVDLLSILPTYLSLLISGTHFLIAIRILRLFRIFRILKLGRYFTESQVLGRALLASSYKISVFMLSVVLIVIIMGSVMYVVEGGTNGFDSIPHSIYWAIITITTVGYGDIVPVTSLGKLISSVIMILGYSIIAIPTGIVSVEISRATRGEDAQKCPKCHSEKISSKAIYCHQCGHKYD